jgi:hypothetical protein
MGRVWGEADKAALQASDAARLSIQFCASSSGFRNRLASAAGTNAYTSSTANDLHLMLAPQKILLVQCFLLLEEIVEAEVVAGGCGQTGLT